MLAHLAALLAQAPSTEVVQKAPLFIRPLPVWDEWPWLLLPLCAGVAIVYKSIKCATMRRVPWEATVILVWILISMGAAAAALAGVVRFLER